MTNPSPDHSEAIRPTVDDALQASDFLLSEANTHRRELLANLTSTRRHLAEVMAENDRLRRVVSATTGSTVPSDVPAEIIEHDTGEELRESATSSAAVAP